MRLFALSLSLALSTAATAARTLTPEELLQVRRPDDVQVSPDGRWVSFTLRQKSLDENRDLKDVWVAPLAGGAPRQVTRDGKSEHARWSPDGRALLVTSARSGDPQLWLFDVAALGSAAAPGALVGGDPRQLTNLHGGAEGGVWAPDGRAVAFASDVLPACNGDDLCNRKRAEERDASKVRARLESRLFVRHWTQWRDGRRSHLFLLPLPAGAATAAAPLPGPPRDLTPGDADWPTWRLGGGEEYAFSPDGSELYVSHKALAGEAWSTNSDLFSVPAAGGAPRNLTADNPGDDRTPLLSPDGRWVAFVSQRRDGFEADLWRLKLLERKTGKVTVVGDLGDSIEAFAWRRDGKGLVVTAVSKGRVYLHALSLDGKAPRLHPHPASSDFALAPDGTVVAVWSGMNRPPEVFRYDPSRPAEKPQRLTAFNQEQLAGLDLGPPPEELWVEGKDGAKVHAWLQKPPGLAEGKKVPLVVLVHGGPQGAWEDLWGMRWNPAAWAARGYAVLLPNPRGSFGYGHPFVEQISKDWGGLAYDDVLRAVDAAEKLPFVQPGKACVAGASFGGYMVDWIAGHTDRFKCLVSHAGVFDLRSMYGATEELWFPEFDIGGPYWENPEAYAKWSPSSYVSAFKTPTLVVHGELDFRVPCEQGLQMFTALQRKGVESKLLWFPDEGHWVNKPRNSLLWHKTVLDWVDAHLK